MLRFFAHFEEELPAGFSSERRRVRRLELLLYLVDDTVEVVEPRVANSGLAQGAFLKRTRVPLASSSAAGGFVGEDDLCVGGQLRLFSRTLHIHGADDYTRAYYAARGIELAANGAPPSDDHEELQQAMARASVRSPCGVSDAVARGVRFLANDGLVLSFTGRLEERSHPAEEAKETLVRFYLADETIEISQKGGGLLLRRTRLPVTAPSASVDCVGIAVEAYVGAEALVVGTALPVYSWTVTLTDADAFTRDWFARTLGVTQPTTAPPTTTSALPPKVQRITKKEHDRISALSGVELRFTATMVRLGRRPLSSLLFVDLRSHPFASWPQVQAPEATKPMHETDDGRTFVMTLFLVDESISIFETPQRGIPGGRYLERVRVPKPGHNEEGDHWAPGDFVIGRILSLFGKGFHLTGSDEFTAKWQATSAV